MKGVQGCREVKMEFWIACRSGHSHKFCWVSRTLSHFFSKSELYLVKAGCLENLLVLKSVYVIFSIYIHFSKCILHQVIRLSDLCINSLLLVCCKCFANYNQLRYIRLSLFTFILSVNYLCYWQCNYFIAGEYKHVWKPR